MGSCTHSALSSQADEKTPSCPKTHKERNNRRSIVIEISLQNIPLKDFLKTSSQNIPSKHSLKISSQNILLKYLLKKYPLKIFF
jgi:hypothetical protein